MLKLISKNLSTLIFLLTFILKNGNLINASSLRVDTKNENPIGKSTNVVNYLDDKDEHLIWFIQVCALFVIYKKHSFFKTHNRKNLNYATTKFY
jgi:hypothetical protein